MNITVLAEQCRQEVASVVREVHAKTNYTGDWSPTVDQVVAGLMAVPLKVTNRTAKRAGVCKSKLRTVASNGRICKIFWPVMIHVNVKVCHTEEAFTHTFKHELAHAAAALLSGQKIGHGPLWQHLMRKLGLPTERCTPYELSHVKGLTPVSCSCKTHYISKRMANNILRGTDYRCMRCKTKITAAAHAVITMA